MGENKIGDLRVRYPHGTELVEDIYPYPRETVKYREVCDNLNLLYNRFSFWSKDKNGKPDTGYKALEKGAERFAERIRSCDCPNLWNMLNTNMEKIAEIFDTKIRIIYQPLHRLLIGIGPESPYSSTSLMTLHHVYGIPYIPGSAIKGVLRNCWIQENFEGKEEDALKCDVFRALFGGSEDVEAGTQAQAGALTFFDSFPVDGFQLEFDVQTPHYPDYYQSQKAPTDDQKPIPISIPAIVESKFLVMIAVNNDKWPRKYYNDVEEMLGRALTEYGLGAKTALGYGLGEVYKLSETSK